MAHQSRRKHLKHVAAHRAYTRKDPAENHAEDKAAGTTVANEVSGPLATAAKMRSKATSRVKQARARVTERVNEVRHKAESFVARAKEELSSIIHKRDKIPLE